MHVPQQPLTLIVDHRQARARKIRRLLEAENYQVQGAASLDGALEALEANEDIQVVLLALDLPTEEEGAPLDRIRSSRAGVAVVVVAEESRESAARKAVSAGAQGYLLESQLHAAVIRNAVRDALERSRAVAEAERAEAALVDCERRYRSLFDLCHEAICVVDAQGLIRDANRAAFELVGAPRHNLTGRLVDSLFIQREDRALVRKTVTEREMLTGGEMPVRGADGSPTPVIVSVGPRQGGPGAYVVMQDLTRYGKAGGSGPSAAFQDPLTHIPNRGLFMDRLSYVLSRRTRRGGSTFAVLFVDLDGFKDVNDHFGHDVGDELLQQVAGRLSDSLREEDTVARLGGDEFVVLLTHIDAIEDATIIADRILHYIGQAFQLTGREVRISCSVGITVGAHEAGSPEELLRQADYAMYQAKSLGPGRYQIYDRDMQARVLQTLSLDAELRRALTRKEFVIHYQPVVHADTGVLRGFEALVRWRHPERGLVPPSDFIPVAEQRGFIEAIGSWVLHEVCRQLREWRELYPASDSIEIAVNLSAAEFLRPDFVDDVQRAMHEHEIPAASLRLELRESTLAADPTVTISAFRRLRNLGVRVSIDDFGHGFSSWSYLERTPVDSLKIPPPDRISNRTEGNGGTPTIRRITQLARCLGMSAVAQGVETEEELEACRRAGSNLAQGYLFWKPLEAAEAAALLENGSTGTTEPTPSPT